jgi:hypothetical protein
MFFPAADTIAFTEGGAESMRIDSSGNVGIGATTITNNKLLVKGAHVSGGAVVGLQTDQAAAGSPIYLGFFNSSNTRIAYLGSDTATNFQVVTAENVPMIFGTNDTARMRIDSSGRLQIGTTSNTPVTSNTYGVTIGDASNGTALAGVIQASANGNAALFINRGSDDGNLVSFYQAGTQEGTISVSGSTVSYNGGHLSRWSQLPDGSKDDAILKGTVMSNLDDMCVWEKDGVVSENEQLNKMKVSDVVGDTNVAGVFVNWTMDEDYGVDDMNVAMTGDMIIRIADGVVVQKGDLLMSAGDGTAKPQGDDIVRSKTVAKVTSNHVTCTYADGSYCVPCVLMAC